MLPTHRGDKRSTFTSIGVDNRSTIAAGALWIPVVLEKNDVTVLNVSDTRRDVGIDADELIESVEGTIVPQAVANAQIVGVVFGAGCRVPTINCSDRDSRPYLRPQITRISRWSIHDEEEVIGRTVSQICRLRVDFYSLVVGVHVEHLRWEAIDPELSLLVGVGSPEPGGTVESQFSSDRDVREWKSTGVQNGPG